MPDKRVTVWVQHFKDRASLVLQWIDPETGQRKSRTANTNDEKDADKARADLEYELNHGRYQEASRMTWERFRELFEAEYLPNVRPGTRRCYDSVMNVTLHVTPRPNRLPHFRRETTQTLASTAHAQNPAG